jgi:hypothetical protein
MKNKYYKCANLLAVDLIISHSIFPSIGQEWHLLTLLLRIELNDSTSVCAKLGDFV